MSCWSAWLGDVSLTRAARLAGKLGAAAVRIDAEELSSLSVLADPAAGTLRVGSLLLRPAVTWIRHFSGRAVRVGGPPAVTAFVQDSWRALISQLHEISAYTIPSRQPGLLDQQALARRLGIAVPRTVVVTGLSEARELIRSPRVVIKSVGGHFAQTPDGALTGIFPEIVPREWLGTDAELPGAPVIVQEFIEHDTELRVYFVRGDVYAFEISKNSPSSPWTEPDNMRAAAVRPPAAVRAAAARIAAALHLDYGAFDFLMRRAAPVFLEVNVTGDWSWIEDLAGTEEVTAAVARMLRDLSVQAVPGERRFDLLSFLALPATAGLNCLGKRGRAAIAGWRRSEMVGFDDRLGEAAGIFLRDVVPDRQGMVRVLAGEMRAV